MVIITGLVVITGIVPPSRVHAKSVNLVHQCKVGIVLMMWLVRQHGIVHRPTQIHGLARLIPDTEHLNTVWLVVLAHIPPLLGHQHALPVTLDTIQHLVQLRAHLVPINLGMR